MKSITAYFSGAEDAELCILQLNPYSDYVSLTNENPGSAMPRHGLFSNDCGLNAYWGIDNGNPYGDTPFAIKGYNSNSTDPTRRPHRLRVSFDDQALYNVMRIIRQCGGIISESDSYAAD
ncbi:hypothetical protein SDC9_159360 [bioreactor metagenome]|uniref:Uncharacterized protein n=1 Tax=bioreactor metagenome TaxID=1076179 RepID=A0A645FDL3_9ZZZZ|nr:hypothetical protein [Oscillospiraceae bacterium]